MHRRDSMQEHIPFSAYMSQSLYGQDGYYTSPHRVGTKGDFYTSVSTSRFFGGGIATYILSLVENGALSLPLRIVEIGADKGYLLGDIALFLDALSEYLLPQCNFITIEPLPSLAKAQEAHFSTLKSSIPIHFATFTDFTAIPKPQIPTSLFVITNELFDSFPCEVLSEGKTLYIKQDSHIWSGIWQDVESPALKANDIRIPNISTFSGVVPLWNSFLTSLAIFAKSHTQSYFMSFDYGSYGIDNALSYNPRFYHQHNVLTLADFLQEKSDFRTLYQQADITYDVDFELLHLLLSNVGFKQIFSKSQAHVLIEDMHLLALLESFSAQKSYKHYFREIQKVKTLLHTMGERFKGICYKLVS